MPTTSNFGWTTPADTDLVKDGALAIRTLGNGIDTSMAELKGGTTGQVLSKTSNTDMDFTWVTTDDANAIQNAIVDAKGDLITATAADTPARLAVGTDGYILTADSTTATGLKWAAAAGGGKVLQVVYGSTSTAVTNATTSFADSNLSASITPSATSSKVLILVAQQIIAENSSYEPQAFLRLLRGSTTVFEQSGFGSSSAPSLGTTDTNDNVTGIISLHYLDSPSTTSSTTYKTQFKPYRFNNIGQARAQQVSEATSTMILLEIGA